MLWAKAFAIAGAAFGVVVIGLICMDIDGCKSIGYKFGLTSRWSFFRGCDLKFPETGWEKVQ